jgi:hypothetical protein
MRKRIPAQAALAASLLACACGPPAASDGHWQRVGGLDGDVIPFVEIQSAAARDGAVYRDAINRLCGPGRCVQVGFFMAGDAIPPSGPRGDFFRAGGWARYRPLAIYMAGSDEFTLWDCQRAGTEAAPRSALCGEGVREQFEAVLRLAARDGWVQGCALPPFGGRAIVERFAAGLEATQRNQVLADYEQHYASSTNGPDLPSDCQALRPRIERDAERAKATLEAAIDARGSGTGAR